MLKSLVIPASAYFLTAAQSTEANSVEFLGKFESILAAHEFAYCESILLGRI